MRGTAKLIRFRPLQSSQPSARRAVVDRRQLERRVIGEFVAADMQSSYELHAPSPASRIYSGSKCCSFSKYDLTKIPATRQVRAFGRLIGRGQKDSLSMAVHGQNICAMGHRCCTPIFFLQCCGSVSRLTPFRIRRTAQCRFSDC